MLRGDVQAYGCGYGDAKGSVDRTGITQMEFGQRAIRPMYVSYPEIWLESRLLTFWIVDNDNA